MKLVINIGEMNRYLLSILLFMTAVCACAQEKKWGHNIYVAGGLLIDREWGKNETGTSMKLGYGLNYNFSEQWSIMSGLAIRRDAEHFFSSELYGEDSDDFQFLDIPVLMQFNVNKWAFGLGPVFSFCIVNDEYHLDRVDSPYTELNGNNKIKTFYFSLQPCVRYNISRHFWLGVEGNIGLMNVNKTYDLPIPFSKKYLHNAMVVVGFRL